MRVACVLITRLRGKIEMRRRPRLKDAAALIVDRQRARKRPIVVDRFPNASAALPGMTLEAALSRCENPVALDADEPHYRSVFNQTLAALQRVSDRVEGDGLGVAYVRVDGLERLYRGEAGTVSALLNAPPSYLNPRVGVADAKFPALVAARVCGASRAARAPDDVAGFLAPHPVDLLPVDPQVVGGLRSFGLRAMGDVAAMRKGLLIDRFGHEGGRAWELSNGIDDSPLIPMPFDESIVEHVSLPFSSSSLEALFVAVDALVKRGFERADLPARHVGVATLQCAATGWAAWEKIIGFKQPVAAWERASFAIRSAVEADPPSMPFEDVTLTLSGFSGEPGTQMSLLQEALEGRERRLVEAERGLQARLAASSAAPRGKYSLYAIAEVAPWHPAPEMRAFQAPIDPLGRDEIKPLHTPAAIEVREGSEGQPASMRLKRRWMRVTDVVDTWTFDLWWLPEPVARAYYRVDSEDGRRITLFRDLGARRWYRQTA